MHEFVKERIEQIVDAYPIGEEFTTNCIHSKLFQKHGKEFLPSRVAVASQLSKLSNLKVATRLHELKQYSRI